MNFCDNKGTFTDDVPVERAELASDLLAWSEVLDTVKVTFHEFQLAKGGAQVKA